MCRVVFPGLSDDCLRGVAGAKGELMNPHQASEYVFGSLVLERLLKVGTGILATVHSISTIEQAILPLCRNIISGNAVSKESTRLLTVRYIHVCLTGLGCDRGRERIALLKVISVQTNVVVEGTSRIKGGRAQC